MPTVPILSLREVTRSSGDFKAVHPLSFDIAPGESVGLLGPNGAGKTTTISMITGLLRPDSGTIKVKGQVLSSDTSPIKRAIGLVPQDLALYDELNGWDNLRFFGALYHLGGKHLTERMEHSLRFVGLLDRAKDKIKAYSGGMKRRMNLAAALLHEPEILLLDEPTVGVDPQSRNSIFENIAQLRTNGKTIIYTTHYMEEVERLCDRIIIMDHGKVVVDDNLNKLRNSGAQVQRLVLELSEPPTASVLDRIRKLGGVQSVSLEKNRLTTEVETLQPTTVLLLQELKNSSVGWTHISSERPNLESVFLRLTGDQLRDS
jgi:ABC-2 type transport system ATP-binding protein